jgi:Holliday junction resolvase|tara:strand:+ start:4949 stop:5290 length:342 start_codon:yes stop_codon:yes gene_type:complete
MNTQKNKGDRAEREACIYLSKATGYEVERRFGAGMEKDKGDLTGIPNTVVQVTDMKNKAEAVLRKPREAEQQRINAKADHAITMVRFNKRPGCAEGDNWRVVMTIEQFARLIR